MKKNAVASFHRLPENYNCAQAVLHGYQRVTGDRGLPVACYKPYGGGRAPGGVCGALYAACELAPERSGELMRAFEARAGSTLCTAIKLDSKYPCVSCVGDGAALLQAALDGRPLA